MEAIYNYLVPSYVPKTDIRRSIHKKSELKEHYNNIVKMTKNSPLYIIKLSNDKQTFALNIKEMAMNLQSISKDLEEDESGAFNKKSAYSEEENVVAAKMLEGKEDSLPSPFTIHVKSLARPQVNTGTAYNAMEEGVQAGEYSFKVKIENSEYEFPFIIEEGMTNYEIGTKFVNFLNQADIGIQANLSWTEQNEMVRMELQSFKTGDTEGLIFELSDVNSPNRGRGIVDYYGLNRFTQTPRSAVFNMNGQETKALSNRFILNGSLEVQLLGASEGDVQIGYKKNGIEAIEKIEEVIKGWNQLIDKAYEYSNKVGSYPKLANELKSIINEQRSELESAGIIMEEEGKLSMDAALAMQAFEEGDLKELFSKDSGFITKIKEKMNQISTDPMEYVDKKMVSYPNLRKQGFSYTYMTSMYSGMLFNYYC